MSGSMCVLFSGSRKFVSCYFSIQQRFTETNEAFEPEIYSVFGTESQNCSFFMKQNMVVPFS